MNGFDWNGNDNRDFFDDYMDYEMNNSGSGGSGDNTSGGNGKGFGCGWVVIVIVVVMLLYFIFTGVSWDGIDSLLGLGFLAFLFARWIST